MNTLASLLGFFGKDVDAIRTRAAAIDADFARKQFQAERVLSGIRHRNAIEASERLLDFTATSSAPGLCLDCINATPGRHS